MCDCKVLKRFDDDYHICLCGRLHPIFPIGIMPIPPKYVRKGTAIKEFCVRGHARTPDNLTPQGKCKACISIYEICRRKSQKYKEYQNNYKRALLR